jgi:hypothetical protein
MSRFANRSAKLHSADEHAGGPRLSLLPLHEHSARLQQLHDKHLSDYAELRGSQFAYRKALHGYLKEAEGEQIPVEDALAFHKKKTYDTAMAMHHDCSGGQSPGVIIFANTSEDFSFIIFSGGIEEVKGKRLVGGAFGGAINVRKEKHLNETTDFISSAYMNGHMVDKDPAVPYEPIICAYGDINGKLSEKDTVELARKRRERFISDWRNAGFMVFEEPGKTPYRVTLTKGEHAKTYIPIVLHDLKECRYYVIENGGRLPFEDWVKGAGLDTREVVQKHLANFRMHEQEKGYFEEFAAMTSKLKGLCCVDSRHQREDESAIKDLGAIATEEQRIRILDTPGIRKLTVCLHFGCGYLQTAMGAHEAGMELKRAFDKGIADGKESEARLLRNEFERRVEQVLNGNWRGFDLEAYQGMVEKLSGTGLSGETVGFLKKLFTSEFSDTRNTAQHMVKRGMLEWSDELGTIVMPAAAEVDRELDPKNKLLPQNRSTNAAEAKEQKQTYFNRITLVAARQQKEAWESSVLKQKKNVSISVRIENFENGQLVATSNGLDAYDAVTGMEI